MKCYFCDKPIYYNWADETFSACQECLDRFGFVMMQGWNKGFKEIHIEFYDFAGFWYEPLREVWARGE